ncbi:hypothetical protein Tco_1407589 [Tanacetum coccineum]
MAKGKERSNLIERRIEKQLREVDYVLHEEEDDGLRRMADGTSIDGIDVFGREVVLLLNHFLFLGQKCCRKMTHNPVSQLLEQADGTRINDWECPKCGNGNFSFRLQNQPRVPVSLLDIAWTLYSVPSIFSVCIDLDRDSNDIRTMAEMSKAVLQAADKGKMTVLQPEIITLQDIRPTHTRKTIELWVYCKWIDKNVTTKERTNLCCMLLDRGTIRFGCTDTKKWRRTLDYKTTLNFGRYTRIEPIANDSFPEHYFNFVAYNEVQSKADVKDATLTEQSLMTIPPCQPSHASAAARKELFLDTDATEKKPRQEP